MRTILTSLLAVAAFLSAVASTYSYSFNNTPISEAMVRISKDHPDLDIFFIYKDLGNYRTSAKIHTDDIEEALRQTIALNPITLTAKDGSFFIEALQHGDYKYTGSLIGKDHEPVVAATVLILNPKDSTVMTYGISDADGRFLIPCDKRNVIAKISSLGYNTLYRNLDSFNVGTITMQENSVKLSSVTVVGSNASAYSDRTAYLPSQRQKKAAQNATDLLRFMAIPQIIVNPITSAVTDNSGQSVELFINGMSASPEELEGLRTADVRRVEYLEAPTDPRFKGALRAINFILQEILYGGYTKATLRENFLTGLSNQANIYSKFSYGKMNYDLYLGTDNVNSRHVGSWKSGSYLLNLDEDMWDMVERNETLENSDFKYDNYPLTVRASYNTDKVQIRNTLGFVHFDKSANDLDGRVDFSGREEALSFSRSNPSRKNSASYAGSFFFSFPKDWSLDLTPKFSYTHTDDWFRYQSSDASISRDADEDAYNFRIDVNATKSIGKKHSLMAGFDTGQIRNNLIYSGTEQYSDMFRLSYSAGTVGYNFKTPKVSLSTDMGIMWECSSINGKTLNDVYPFIHVFLQCAFNSRHKLSSFIQYATNSPEIDQKASDILQDNEYLYITGNPYLRDSRHTTVSLTYTWLHSNALSLSAFARYYGDCNRMLTVYSSYDDGKAVIRDYQNNGNYYRTNIGLAANLRLFDDKLLIYAGPTQYFYSSRGLYSNSYNPFSFTASASLFLGSFYIRAYYSSPECLLQANTNAIQKTRNYHMVEAGWSDSHWNLRLAAHNFFNKGWVASTTVMNSEYYSEHRIQYNGNYHPVISLSATYTVSYGKKIQKGNEVGEQSGAASGILK